MQLVASPENLHHHFLQAVSQTKPSQEASNVWRIIVGHPWYQAQLTKISRRVTRGRSRFICAEYVQQEAMLILARSLKAHPHLKFDWNESSEQFSRWMRRIIFRDCLQALRRIKRGRQDVSLTKMHVLELCHQTDVDSLLLESLDCLDSEERFIIDQYVLGHTLKETAELLDVSISTVHRRLQSAIASLRKEFALDIEIGRF